MPIAQDHRPRHLHAPHGATELEITWADGHKTLFPHRILRGYCPCATCQGHGGAVSFIEPGHVEIRELQAVGNYALSFQWSDGHASGIYSFRWLRALGGLLEAQGAKGVEEMGTLPRL